jgi:alkanesulfonate monooxygenase SsuD/methylene tetrahydromethanopterin reductase-like flavin-dependent oxidoreductase (luciferase family)
MSHAEPMAVIAGFLRYHQGEDFCNACLAAAVGLGEADVAAAAEALGHKRRFLRDVWHCSRCRAHRPVTRAMESVRLAAIAGETRD